MLTKKPLIAYKRSSDHSFREKYKRNDFKILPLVNLLESAPSYITIIYGRIINSLIQDKKDRMEPEIIVQALDTLHQFIDRIS